MNKTTFLAAFRCSCCGSWVRQKLLLKHRKAFKGAVVARTVWCYECKR